MKKLCFLLLVLACVSALTGCEPDPLSTETQPPPGTETTVAPQPENTEPIPASDWGISLAAENVTPTGLTLVFTQSGGSPSGELQTGSWFEIEQETDGSWQAVEELPSEIPVVWTLLAYPLPPNGSFSLETGWEAVYGALPAGNYRIAKEVQDFRDTGDYDTRIYYAPFEIPSSS